MIKAFCQFPHLYRYAYVLLFVCEYRVGDFIGHGVLIIMFHKVDEHHFTLLVTCPFVQPNDK